MNSPLLFTLQDLSHLAMIHAAYGLLSHASKQLTDETTLLLALSNEYYICYSSVNLILTKFLLVVLQIPMVLKGLMINADQRGKGRVSAQRLEIYHRSSIVKAIM